MFFGLELVTLPLPVSRNHLESFIYLGMIDFCPVA
jgi:hypothetical protein